MNLNCSCSVDGESAMLVGGKKERSRHVGMCVVVWHCGAITHLAPCLRHVFILASPIVYVIYYTLRAFPHSEHVQNTNHARQPFLLGR